MVRQLHIERKEMQEGYRSQKNDMIGHIFNEWTVMSFSHVKNKNAAYFNCRCSCGEEKEVRGDLLRNGNSKGCKKCSHVRKANEHMGKKFGHLTVSKIDPVKTEKWKQIYVWATCDCGKETSTSLSRLTTGKTGTCSKRCSTFYDLQKYIGQKIVRLTVDDVFYKEPRNRHYFKCSCSCGNNKDVLFKDVIAGRTTSCGCVAKEYAASITGDNNPNWKDGATPELLLARASKEYSSWRGAVLDRDGHHCQKHGCKNNTNLCAHHIEGFASNPNLRYDIDNGITLCDKHHRRFHVEFGITKFTSSNLKGFIAQVTNDSINIQPNT